MEHTLKAYKLEMERVRQEVYELEIAYKKGKLLRASAILHQLILHKVDPSIEPPVMPHRNVQANIRFTMREVVSLYQDIYGADIRDLPQRKCDPASKPSFCECEA